MAATVRIFRLTSSHGKKSLLFQISSQNLSKQICAPISTSSASQNVIRKLVPNEGFWSKNKRMERPMSPHVTIYRFPLPALMSITNRFTGLGWSAAIAGVGLGALLLPGESAVYMEAIKGLSLPIWVLAPAKFVLVWPLTYHTINGVRHLVWDAGRGLHLPSLYKSGFFVIGASVLSAIGIVAYCSS